jgi:MFS family permease
MILGLATMIGILVAWALGAQLGRLADVRFRGDWLVFSALGLQLLIFSPAGDRLPVTVTWPVHIGSYLMIVAFLLINRNVPGFWLAGIGIAMNVLVIFSNGGHMPVSLEAWVATGASASELTTTGVYANNILAGPGTHFAWLGDIFALPPQVPLANAISVGDVLIVIGVVAFVYRSCVPRLPQAPAGLFAPLRHSAFRRVLAGRTTSRMGDWLSMSALVTWIYSETRSGTAVALFLLVRMLASLSGGVASAPLLDRYASFRILSWVEAARGGLTLVMLPFAITGHLLPVIFFACISVFIGSATNPTASGLLPDVLPISMLQAGNALHGFARNSTAVIGLAVGGLSVGEFGIQTALALDFVTFLAAAVLYMKYSGAVHAHEDDEDEHLVTRRDLVRTLCTNRVAFGLMTSFTITTMAMALVNSSISAFFDHRMHNSVAYGYAMSAVFLGLMSGELLTGLIRRDSVARRSIALSFFAMGAALFVLAHSTVAATAYLMLFLLGASDGTTEVVYDTLFQLNVPRRVLAGAYAMAASIQNIGQVAGFLAAIALVQFTPGAHAILFAALLCAVGGFVAAFALVRRRREGHSDALEETVLRDPIPPAALNELAPALTMLRSDGYRVSPTDLAADGPVVLAFLDSSAYDVPHAEALTELAQTATVFVVTAGPCPVAAVLTSTGTTVRLEAEDEVFDLFGVAPGCSGLAVIDSEGIVRLLFSETTPGDWIPTGVVRSRLRRLAPAEPKVEVVRTTLTSDRLGTPKPA